MSIEVIIALCAFGALVGIAVIAAVVVVSAVAASEKHVDDN